MTTYIHYSTATDVTGPALVERLGVRGGTQLPTFNGRNACTVYIGWGCKTTDDVNIPNGVTILNHANRVKANRNKLEALGIMKGARVPVADFLACERRRRNDPVTNIDALHRLGYPLIGRTKYHQGGKGFWTILDRQMLEQACKEGCAYVQKRIAITDEYRLHIFDGNVIYAVKKVPQDNPKTSWTASMKEKIVAKAQADNVRMVNPIVDLALDVLSEEHARPDMLIRSNTRGWKFSRIQLNNVGDRLREAALAAVNSLNLQFGAVDMAIEGNTVYVIEVNSAPGLERTTLDTWVNTMQTYLRNLAAPARAQQPQRQAAAAAQANRDENQEWLDNLAQEAGPEEAAAVRRLLGRLA
jgi:glutathione synthase/RimK-type ligase-like ATP-grasp enzyme